MGKKIKKPRGEFEYIKEVKSKEYDSFVSQMNEALDKAFSGLKNSKSVETKDDNQRKKEEYERKLQRKNRKP